MGFQSRIWGIIGLFGLISIVEASVLAETPSPRWCNHLLSSDRFFGKIAAGKYDADQINEVLTLNIPSLLPLSKKSWNLLRELHRYYQNQDLLEDLVIGFRGESKDLEVALEDRLRWLELSKKKNLDLYEQLSKYLTQDELEKYFPSLESEPHQLITYHSAIPNWWTVLTEASYPAEFQKSGKNSKIYLNLRSLYPLPIASVITLTMAQNLSWIETQSKTIGADAPTLYARLMNDFRTGTLSEDIGDLICKFLAVKFAVREAFGVYARLIDKNPELRFQDFQLIAVSRSPENDIHDLALALFRDRVKPIDYDRFVKFWKEMPPEMRDWSFDTLKENLPVSPEIQKWLRVPRPKYQF